MKVLGKSSISFTETHIFKILICHKLCHFIEVYDGFIGQKILRAGKPAIWPWLSCRYNKHRLVDLLLSMVGCKKYLQFVFVNLFNIHIMLQLSSPNSNEILTCFKNESGCDFRILPLFHRLFQILDCSVTPIKRTYHKERLQYKLMGFFFTFEAVKLKRPYLHTWLDLGYFVYLRLILFHLNHLLYTKSPFRTAAAQRPTN